MFLTKMNGKIQGLSVLRLASVCNCMITLYHRATSQCHLASHLVRCFCPQKQFKLPKAIRSSKGNSGVQGQFRCSGAIQVYFPLSPSFDLSTCWGTCGPRAHPRSRRTLLLHRNNSTLIVPSHRIHSTHSCATWSSEGIRRAMAGCWGLTSTVSELVWHDYHWPVSHPESVCDAARLTTAWAMLMADDDVVDLLVAAIEERTANEARQSSIICIVSEWMYSMLQCSCVIEHAPVTVLMR